MQKCDKMLKVYTPKYVPVIKYLAVFPSHKTAVMHLEAITTHSNPDRE